MGTLILRSLAGPDCPFMGLISGGAGKFTWVQEQLATMGRFSYFPAGVKTDHSMLYWGCKYATLTLSRNSSTKTFVFKNHFYLILHYKIKIMLQFPLDQLFFGRSCSTKLLFIKPKISFISLCIFYLIFQTLFLLTQKWKNVVFRITHSLKNQSSSLCSLFPVRREYNRKRN